MRLVKAFGGVAILFAIVCDDQLLAEQWLNRSIYLPVEFRLCEHLGDAVFYQDDALVSTMPARRIFQFTYYPELDELLPGSVPVRIEGRYLDLDDDENENETFVARLAVSPTGVHSAHRSRETDVLRQVEEQKSKIDVRLEEKKILLRCPRFCKRESSPDGTTGKD